MSRGTVVLLATAAAILALAGGPVSADYQGPDDNTSQAFGPLEGGHSYSATLNKDGSKSGDQDWYYYYVPTAGVRLHWTVSNDNKVTDCPPYVCNLYATLEDVNGQQLGGGSSSAGTSGAAPGTTQTIDWTFKEPGKYYIAFVGDGPKIAYHFKVTPDDGVSSSPPGPGGGTPSLKLSARQSGRDVAFGLVVPDGGGRVDATVTARSVGSNFRAGSLHRSNVGSGSRHFAIRLGSRALAIVKKKGRLSVTLRVTVTPSGGQPIHASKRVTVRRP